MRARTALLGGEMSIKDAIRDAETPDEMRAVIERVLPGKADEIMVRVRRHAATVAGHLSNAKGNLDLALDEMARFAADHGDVGGGFGRMHETIQYQRDLLTTLAGALETASQAALGTVKTDG